MFIRLAPLVALVACGDVVNNLPDGPLGDDAAPTIDSAAQFVEVITYSPEGVRHPNPGVAVVFVEPNGTQHRATSDLDGIVREVVPSGSSVTAVWLRDTESYLAETVFAVEPGDHIVMAGSSLGYQSAGEYTVMFPPFAGASFYYAYTSCGANYTTSTSVIATIYEHCKAQTMTVAVVAYDAMGFPVGYIEKPGVAFMDGGYTALTGTYASPSTFQATYTNLDPATQSYLSTNRYAGPRGFSSGDGAPITMSSTTLSAPTPVTAAAYVQTSISNQQNGYQRILQKIAGASLAYNLDVTNNLTQWAGLPVLDPATRSIAVTTTGTRPPDGVSAQIYFTKPNPAGSTQIRWIVIAPSFDNLTLPDLPIEVGDIVPRAGDGVGIGSTLAIESDGIAGYATVREDFYGLVDHASDDFANVADQIVRISESYFD